MSSCLEGWIEGWWPGVWLSVSCSTIMEGCEGLGFGVEAGALWPLHDLLQEVPTWLLSHG